MGRHSRLDAFAAIGRNVLYEPAAAPLTFLKTVPKTAAAPLTFLKTVPKTVAAPQEFPKTVPKTVAAPQGFLKTVRTISKGIHVILP